MDDSAVLLLAHAWMSSPESRAFNSASHAHPMEEGGAVLAHNGTLWDYRILCPAAETDTQVLIRWTADRWHPRTPERLAYALQELLTIVRDYTALNLILSDHRNLYALCCYRRDTVYCTLWYMTGERHVVMALEPGPGPWRPIPNHTLLMVGLDLKPSSMAI